MRRTAVLLVVATTISGCASFTDKSIDAQSTSNLKGQTVTYTARKKPDFAAMTAGKAAFALLGAFAMISEGNSIVASNNVADPADSIALGLAKELETAHGTRLVTPPARVDAEDSSQVAAAVNGTARFVIDAQTINWSFGYFPTDWTHYHVIYTAKARLIDAQTKAVVGEGFCKHIADSDANAPTYDELLANKAARLKSELNEIAKNCVTSMKKQMLSL